jgi:hypothetical protein
MAMTADELLLGFGGETETLGQAARKYLFKQLKDVQEEVDEKAKLLGYSYGPGYKNMICTLILSKKGIKMGFNRGTELSDPGHLLEGTGKVHKYVQLHSQTDLKNPALGELLKEALKAYKQRTS